MHKVSVIIPNYNNSKWLLKTIKSCLIQKHLHEIIIVDDFSSDNSWEVLQAIKKKYPNIIQIYRNKKKGGNNARNFGFSKSSGNYIQWLDADDFLLPNKFETQIKQFEEKPDVDIVYSDWYLDIYKNTSIFIKREKHKQQNYKDFVFEIISDNWSANNSYLFKRHIAEKLHKNNGWNPETIVGQDREYVTMAALYGAKFYYIPGFFCVYNRWNTNSVSSINFKLRWLFQLKLENRFTKEIIKNGYPKKTKKKYLSILNANAMNSCFYNLDATILNSFSFFNINWKFINWKKHPFIPFIYLWQHIKFYLKNKH